MKYYAFVHYGMNTFTNREWGDGKESESIFNPKKQNTDQWCEAIKAAHENLRLTARKAQRTFGSGFLNVGYLAACVRDNYAYDRQAFRGIKPTWAPIFEPDAAALSGLGDAIYKINEAFPGYLGESSVKQITGLESGD